MKQDKETGKHKKKQLKVICCKAFGGKMCCLRDGTKKVKVCVCVCVKERDETTKET